MKKVISVLLIALLILGSLSLTACGTPGMQFYSVKELKESDKEELESIVEKLSNLDDCNDDDYVCVLKKDAKGDIEIPSEYKDKDVVYVTAAESTPEMTSLTVPGGVMYIEDVCNNTSGASIESVSLSPGIIVMDCFIDCPALTKAELDGASMIDNSFKSCSLEAASIKNTNEIYDSFNECSSLKTAELDTVDKLFSSFCDCENLQDPSLVNIQDIKESFNDCSSIKKISVEKVYNSFRKSFNRCDGLETVKLSGSFFVTECFNDCRSLNKISGQRAEMIDESFNNCSSLKTLSLPSAKDVHTSFCNCEALEEIDEFGEDATIAYSFCSCPKLKSIVQLKGTPTISDSFCKCDALSSAEFAKSASSVDSSFQECPALEKIVFDGIGEINHSFKDCDKLKAANVIVIKSEDENTLSINASFIDCKALESVSVSGKIGSISESFLRCPELKTFKYDHLDKLEDSFEDCPKLTAKILTDGEKEKKRKEEEARKKKEEEERKRKEELDNEPYGPGTSALELSADDDMSACYRLLRMNGSEEFMVFLEPGESTTKYFPSGRYTLKVAEGKKWISDKEAFGSSGHYSTTEIYTFEDGYSYSITTGDHGDFRSDSASGFVS